MKYSISISQLSFLKKPRAKIYSLASRTKCKLLLPQFFPRLSQLPDNFFNPVGSGTITGTGINCPGDCSEAYDSGTVVTVTANANSDYQFEGWTGCDSPSGNICAVTMNSDRTVTANFSATVATISINPTSINFGSVNVKGYSIRTITISNTGTGGLIIGTITIAGTDASELSPTSALLETNLFKNKGLRIF